MRLYSISLYVAVVAMFGGIGSIAPQNFAGQLAQSPRPRLTTPPSCPPGGSQGSPRSDRARSAEAYPQPLGSSPWPQKPAPGRFK